MVLLRPTCEEQRETPTGPETLVSSATEGHVQNFIIIVYFSPEKLKPLLMVSGPDLDLQPSVLSSNNEAGKHYFYLKTELMKLYYRLMKNYISFLQAVVRG